MARKRKETLFDRVVRVSGVHRTMTAGLGVSPDEIATAFDEAMGIVAELMHRRGLAAQALNFEIDIGLNDEILPHQSEAE